MIAALRPILLPSAPGALRLWLALVVVFHHVTRIEVGKAPVLVFFALSGYWVYKVWNARYAQTVQPWLTFVISRWWRLAPVMVLAVCASIAALIVTHDGALPFLRAMPLRQAFSSVFVFGYAQMPVRPLGPAWSLDIEMQFYLAAPLLALLVRRIAALFALAGAYFIYTAGIAVYPELVLSSFLVPFVLGMVAARHDWSVSPRIGAAGQALAIALVAAAWLSPWRAQLLGSGENAWWPSLNILLAALVLPQALVSVQNRGGPRDQLWADQSYVVYMLHWPAILLLRGIHWSGPLGWYAALAVLTPLTAALCWAVHRAIDLPLNRARARWVKGRIRRAASPLPDPTKRDDSAAVFA